MLNYKTRLVLITLTFTMSLGLYNSAYSKLRQKGYELESAYFRVKIDKTGAICSFYNKESKKEIPFNGRVGYMGCSSQILSVKTKNGIIIVKKKSVVNGLKVILTTETFGIEDDLLKWDLIINPEGNESWSTPVQTIWSMPGDAIKYWTTWEIPGRKRAIY